MLVALRCMSSMSRPARVSNQVATPKPQRHITKLLEEVGATYVRTTKHHIYRLPNGKTFAVANSPSDHRHMANLKAKLRRALACGFTGF